MKSQFLNLLHKILSQKLLKKTAKLTIITILANVLGFLVPVYIANVYGVTKTTDDFLLSYSIINFIGVIFAGALSGVCVPYLKERLNNKDEFTSFASNVLYQITKFIGTLCIICFLASATLFVYLRSPLYLYIAISSPIFFFSVVNAYYYGILNSIDKFTLAAASPFSRAVIIFLCIFLFNKQLGIYSAILGYNLGECGKFLQLTYVIRIKNNIRLNLRVNNFLEISDFVKTGSYQTLSAAISASSPLVDKIYASFLIAGTISILDYGSRLFMIFTVILNSFLVIVLSKWSSEIVNGHFSFSSFKKILMLILALSVFALLAIFVLKQPVIHLLYPKLSFSEREKIGILLTLNMAGFVFNSGNQVINRGIIAFKGTNLLVKLSLVRISANLVLNAILMTLFGLYGIVYSTILTNLICFVLAYKLFSGLVPKIDLNYARN